MNNNREECQRRQEERKRRKGKEGKPEIETTTTKGKGQLISCFVSDKHLPFDQCHTHTTIHCDTKILLSIGIIKDKKNSSRPCLIVVFAC